MEVIAGGLIALISAVVGFLAKPVDRWIGGELRHRRDEEDRRQRFQIDTLHDLSVQLEKWRYAGDTITSETAKAQVEILIFRVHDELLRALVEKMLVTRYSDPAFGDTYGDVVRKVGEIQREL